MAKTKYKTTGCAKFFLVILLLAPVAYIAASYLNGENGLQKIKDLFSSKERTEIREDGGTSNDQSAEIRDLTREIRIYKKEVERLENELEACQEARQPQ